MEKTKPGEAISASGRTKAAMKKLQAFIRAADSRSDLACWRRGRAVLGYIEGRRVIELAVELGITRGAINRWLRWYELEGVDGLSTGKPPGRAPILSEVQRAELTAIIEAGPLAAGYSSGVWTGPMIGDLIEERYDIRYHNNYVPRLLHSLGFSVQRPRKRLARADAQAQAQWLKQRLPEIKKKPRNAEDE